MPPYMGTRGGDWCGRGGVRAGDGGEAWGFKGGKGYKAGVRTWVEYGMFRRSFELHVKQAVSVNMKFLSIFVALVGVTAALPEPVAEPETPAHATLVSARFSKIKGCHGADMLLTTGQERLQRQ